jgi:hypothetical protein
MHQLDPGDGFRICEYFARKLQRCFFIDIPFDRATTIDICRFDLPISIVQEFFPHAFLNNCKIV